MNTCMKCAHRNVCEWCIEDSEYEFPTCSDFLEERPHGEWELVHPLQENDTGDYKCSVCGWGGFVIKPTNYCPYCGAEMRVKDELKGEKE